ncbi:hypothetical protein EDB85DRAFT_594781 [Lactarius pseudohatsudake]|nr:hypothetical protein EDB85DRAFT_594781 [Lactarius pseudohatsudake]
MRSKNVATRFGFPRVHGGFLDLCLLYVGGLAEVVLDNYRPTPVWLATDSGKGCGGGAGFLRRGKDGTLIL